LDAIESLKRDLRAGRLDADRLIELLAISQQQLQSTQQQLQQAIQIITQLERKLGDKPPPTGG
jgi:hypothetical protein